MLGLTRALAKELGAENLAQLRPCAGSSQGGNTGRAHLPDTLVGRRGKPEEIASMVGFLWSDEARFITGQKIHANGGAFLL
jgi:3-oxoacyl-[acyl-carrier protein] reductase